MQQFDLSVRHQVYDVTMREGTPPTRAHLATTLQASVEDTSAALQRLAEQRMLVLQRDSGEILMAGPFSAVPTAFPVRINNLLCYGNCIWDALGIAATLRSDADIDTSCADCGTATHLMIRNGAISGDEGFMHFPLPPRVWWQDVVYT